MQWNKAGRPRKEKGKAEVKVEREDRPWTRREMKIHTDSVRALANAVIKQWLEDGKPKQDLEVVKLWCSVIEMERRHDDDKEQKPYVPGVSDGLSKW